MTDIVFSVLFGGYEELNEQPLAHESNTPFVCFTDNPSLRSDTWEIVQVNPLFKWDAVRSARAVKIRADPVWSDSERSLWIDNRVILKQSPSEVLDSWLAGSEQIAIPTHSYRSSVNDEFAAVVSAGYDQLDRVREQWRVMQEHHPSVLRERPYWTGMMARRHTEQVGSAMEFWSDMVLRHSRRDQLSINLAVSQAGLKVRRMELDNYESDFHRWITVRKRESILFGRDHYSLRQHVLDSGRRRVSVIKHRYSTRNF